MSAEKTKNALQILKESQSKTTSLLLTNKGTQKESIYKNEIFAELNETQKKSTRKKIRNYVSNILATIVAKENEKNIKNLCEDFANFYSEIYCVNDYSLSSICSENAKDEKKQNLEKGLQIVKKVLKK